MLTVIGCIWQIITLAVIMVDSKEKYAVFIRCHKLHYDCFFLFHKIIVCGNETGFVTKKRYRMQNLHTVGFFCAGKIV